MFCAGVLNRVPPPGPVSPQLRHAGTRTRSWGPCAMQGLGSGLGTCVPCSKATLSKNRKWVPDTRGGGGGLSECGDIMIHLPHGTVLRPGFQRTLSPTRLRKQMMPVPLPTEVEHPMFRGENEEAPSTSQACLGSLSGHHSMQPSLNMPRVTCPLPYQALRWPHLGRVAGVLNNQLKGRPLDRDRPKANPVTGLLPTLSPSSVTVPAVLGCLLTRAGQPNSIRTLLQAGLSVRFGQAVRSAGSWGRWAVRWRLGWS